MTSVHGSTAASARTFAPSRSVPTAAASPSYYRSLSAAPSYRTIAPSPSYHPAVPGTTTFGLAQDRVSRVTYASPTHRRVDRNSLQRTHLAQAAQLVSPTPSGYPGYYTAATNRYLAVSPTGTSIGIGAVGTVGAAGSAASRADLARKAEAAAKKAAEEAAEAAAAAAAEEAAAEEREAVAKRLEMEASTKRETANASARKAAEDAAEASRAEAEAAEARRPRPMSVPLPYMSRIPSYAQYTPAPVLPSGHTLHGHGPYYMSHPYPGSSAMPPVMFSYHHPQTQMPATYNYC